MTDCFPSRKRREWYPNGGCAVLKARGEARSRQISGGYGEGETPLPIPNRAVKPLSADGTRPARARESRSPPVLASRAPDACRALRRCGTLVRSARLVSFAPACVLSGFGRVPRGQAFGAGPGGSPHPARFARRAGPLPRLPARPAPGLASLAGRGASHGYPLDERLPSSNGIDEGGVGGGRQRAAARPTLTPL